jgi:hypothetical protein
MATYFPSTFSSIKIKQKATEGYTLGSDEYAVATFYNTAGGSGAGALVVDRWFGPTETVGSFTVGLFTYTMVSGVVFKNSI